MPGNLPLVSVLMPIFKPVLHIFTDAVQSILEQSYENLEFIIMEDPSPISIASVIRDADDPRIRVLKNPTRTSLLEQRNTGLRAARGELIAFLDGDDVAESTRIEQQVSFMLSHADISILGSQLRIIDETGTPLGWRCYPLSHRAIVEAMRLYNPVAHPSVMIRPQAINDVGGYKWSYENLNEDYDLWCRLAKAGYGFATSPEALTKYRIHPNGIKVRRVRTMLRGTIKVKRRHWRNEFGWRGYLRLLGEYLLLLLPSAWTLKLFEVSQISRRECAHTS